MINTHFGEQHLKQKRREEMMNSDYCIWYALAMHLEQVHVFNFRMAPNIKLKKIKETLFVLKLRYHIPTEPL